jgi:hypothetical protein
MTCGYKDALRGPKCWRKLQAVRVIASMKAITVDWLSSSKFGSARPTSQTARITAENDHGATIEVDPPAADLAGKCD